MQAPTPGSPRPLIVRIRNWVGDVVLGIPGLRLIESQGYALHIVARGKWAPALLAGYPWPVHLQPAGLRNRARQYRALRAQCLALDAQFDQRENTLLMPESFSAALETRLAGLRTVGYAKEGRTPLMARGEPITLGGHALISYWELANRFLRLPQPFAAPPKFVDLQVNAAKAREADALLAAHGVAGGFVLVCPFAAGLATSRKLEKKWPAFGDFIAQAGARLGLPLVVYPGPGEHAAARALYPAARLIEGADVAVYARLLQRATLVVANDTGPAHMAAALGTRLISVLGPTIAEQWAPWGPRVTVIQLPQPAESTAWPDVETVMAAAQQQLAQAA
jgi:heptosyltransferase-2